MRRGSGAATVNPAAAAGSPHAKTDRLALHAAAPPHLTQLTQLVLSGSDRTDHQYPRELCALLPHMAALRDLVLKSCCGVQPHLQQLFDGLRDAARLRTLHLRCSGSTAA